MKITHHGLKGSKQFFSKGGKVILQDDPEEGAMRRESFYNPLTGREGEPEGYDSRDTLNRYEKPGFPIGGKEDRKRRR